jgi:hypothetical protein
LAPKTEALRPPLYPTGTNQRTQCSMRLHPAQVIISSFLRISLIV